MVDSPILDDDGNVTVFSLTAIIIMLVLSLMALTFGRLALTQRQVQIAADSAALAGAQSLVTQPAASCLSAGSIANLNHARMDRCVFAENSVHVWVSDSFEWLGNTINVSAQARAGAN